VTAARRTLVTASLGTMATLVAFTAPLATVNQTVAGLDAATAGRTWILSSMSIGLGAFLLTAGRVADDFGRRRTFVAGALVLALGSVLAAIAPEVTTFVLARVAQGIGGAAVIAASLGMVAAAFTDPAERARATGVWGASVGAGIAVGPVLSAGLERVGSFRDVYVVLAAAAVGLAATARGCDESRSAHGARLDVPGVVLLAVGMGALLGGLTEGHLGWTRPLVLTLLAAGVVLLGAFVEVERRSGQPMLDLGLFARPAFTAVNLAAVATGGGVIALLSYLPGFVGIALGFSSWTTAWLFLAWSGPSVAMALAARRLPASWTGRSRMAVSLAVIGIGQLLIWHVGPGSGIGRFLPGLLVAGAGSGVLNAALGRESVTSVPAGQGGLGSGATNTARYLGSALGVTVVSIVATPSGVVNAATLSSGWDRAVLATAAVSLLGGLVVHLVGERAEAVAPVAEIESTTEADAA
jgi:MFS family permease